MAIKRVDDLSGEVIPNDRPSVYFAFDGKAYEIDLSPANEQEFRAAVAKFVAAARPVSFQEFKLAAGTPQYEISAARSWLKDNGFDVADRGPIDQDLLTKYEESLGF